jgi:adenylate cyclase
MKPESRAVEAKVQVKPRFSIRLRVSISTMFLAMILPAFTLFAVYIYKTNYDIYKQNASDLIIAYNGQAIEKFSALLDPISDSLLVLAKQIEDDPALFQTGDFYSTMLLHLENNPHLVSVFSASDQGAFQQVQRMRPGMIVAGRVTPDIASYNIWRTDRQSGQAATQKVQSIFSIFDEYGTLLDEYTVPNNYDPRQRPFYKALMNTYAHLSDAEKHRYVLIDKPYISTSTRQPTINVSTPVVVNEEVLGMVGESFAIETLRGFLAANQISPGSVTYVVDGAGTILLATGPDAGITLDGKALANRSLADSSLAAVRLVAQERAQSGKARYEVKDPTDGAVYLAQFNSFPNALRNDWVVVTIAPMSDFLEGLYRINKQLILFGGLACLLLVGLTYVLSRAMSRPIEVLTEQIEDLMDFNDHPPVNSNIVEINILSNAVRRLRNTLYAFTSYVPRDLVSDLLKSGHELSLGGESRYMTIMFTDLQGFSTFSEITPSRQVLSCVSSYLELVTYAVKEEHGTVDKFIGDAVMAFWGAPLRDQDHAYHACLSALKSQHRMKGLNEALAEDGIAPLVVRIGIHSDGVLVGNIGSLERMSYTVMGDGVNIASRLEGINKEFGTLVCISHATYKEAGEKLWARPIDSITVKGRKAELTIYELVGIREEGHECTATEEAKALCQQTWAAYGLMQAQRFAEAAMLYGEIAELYGDRVAAIMRDKCQNL